MHALRGLLKVLIALFCLWHITAVGVYSLYHVEHQPVLAWLDSKRNFFRPYILMTSQWQRWNLFSPDPLRRVIQMTISQKQGDTWKPVLELNENSVGFWRRATELKIMRRMEEENMKPLQERYVHDICWHYDIPEGTPVKMTKQWFVIPKHKEMHSSQWWNAWEPEWYSTPLVETVCPPAP